MSGMLGFGGCADTLGFDAECLAAFSSLPGSTPVDWTPPLLEGGLGGPAQQQHSTWAAEGEKAAPPRCNAKCEMRCRVSL